MSPDHDRVEIPRLVQDRANRMAELHIRGDLDIVGGGQFPGLLKHGFGLLLGCHFEVVLERQPRCGTSHR